MIKAVHTLIYSDDPEATRAFLRDVLGWPSVEDPGTVPPWPIFKTGPSEMGVHPTSGATATRPTRTRGTTRSRSCATTSRRRRPSSRRRVRVFTGGIEDYGFGLAANLELPGAGPILLYEPRHPEAYDLDG